MGRFDTHGGYFAPQDYFRVDTGGSHDENPNGGVQVGVDEQGIPNLLEEGEPVYDDYVYSDNIVSDKEILAKHNLPTRYAGMLYSKIADSFIDEAAERPNDPISNNGLNALLVRLADAQEEQKQIEAQRELEEELAQLSPEELAQVEQALAMQEQQAAAGEQIAAQQDIPQEAMAEQQVVPEEAPAQEQMIQQQVPVMACGGTLLRRFDAGGPKKNIKEFTSGDVAALLRSEPEQSLSDMLEASSDRPTFTSRDNVATRPVIVESGDPSNPVVEVLHQESGQPVSEPVPVTDEQIRNNLELQSMVPYVGIPANAALIQDHVENKRYGDAAVEAALLGAGLIPGGSAAGRMLVRGTKSLLRPAGRMVGRGFTKAIKAIPKSVLEIGGRGEMVKDAVKAAKTAGAEAQKAARDADRIDRQLKAAKVSGDKERVASLTEKLSKADATAVKAGLKSAKAKANVGIKTVGAGTTGPLWNREAWKRSVGSAKKQLDTALDALKANPDDVALKEAAEKARKAYDKAQGFWNKWVRHGEWAKPAVITGGAGVAAAKIHDRNTDRWIQEQLGEPITSEMPVVPVDTSGIDSDWLIENLGSVMPETDTSSVAASDTTANLRALGGPVNKFDGESFSQMFRFKPIAPQRPVAPDVVKLSKNGIEFYPSAYTETRWLIPSSIGWESNPDKIDRLAKESIPGTWEWAQAIGRNNLFSTTGVNLDGVSSGANTGNGADVDAGAGADVNTRAIPLPKPLSTSSRYAGPLTAAALGIYNALQKPTRFTMPHYVPTIPEGRMHLYNPSFNPLDVNLAVNSINASGAGTMYGLRNSGLGPSTAQAMIAVDNNIGKNIGNAQTQAWDANNQRRNAVLAAVNQNGSALGQFDYGVARNAAYLLNDMRLRNAQNDLMLQRLNDASETQQYAAVQNQIDQVAQALSAIGRENLTFNQINSNTALPYNVWNNGAAYYAPTGIQPSNPYADLAYNAKTKEVYNTKTGAVVAKNVG